ncbi:hypothetical protein CDV49_13690 [Haematobacter genomosp. 1]|uniref:Uncharacterized protein n=1 Tax=Haematobacter genomosp. 1 TaxID=366618 RepID=A0A212A9A0_9RHOB|nr:hypothetical protein CDV49_13690 [Haematobacter genomosp. 1]
MLKSAPKPQVLARNRTDFPAFNASWVDVRLFQQLVGGGGLAPELPTELTTGPHSGRRSGRQTGAVLESRVLTGC